MMNPSIVHVVAAEWLGGHRVRLRFDDGVEGIVDLREELRGPVFEPLQDPDEFRNFVVGEGRTLEWANGADLAPELLHDLVLSATARTGG